MTPTTDSRGKPAGFYHFMYPEYGTENYAFPADPQPEQIFTADDGSKWRFANMGTLVWDLIEYAPEPDPHAECRPPAMAERIRELEAANEKLARGAHTLGHALERQNRDIIHITGLHHMIDKDGDGDWGAVWDLLAEMVAKGRASEGRPPAQVIPADERPYETQTAALDALPVHTLISYLDHDGELHTLERVDNMFGDRLWWETTAVGACTTYNLVRNEVAYTVERMGTGR